MKNIKNDSGGFVIFIFALIMAVILYYVAKYLYNTGQIKEFIGQFV